MPDIDHPERCACPACTPDFHDRLAALCGPEIAAAMREESTDRAADLITALATMLGRTIARACRGDAAQIDTMLTGAEQLITTEAAGMADIIAFAQTKGFKP
jgi:hypothetical protein